MSVLPKEDREALAIIAAIVGAIAVPVGTLRLAHLLGGEVATAYCVIGLGMVAWGVALRMYRKPS